MNTNVEIHEKEFESILADANRTYESMGRKSEFLDDYYQINNQIDSINEILEGKLNQTLKSYLKKHNIITKMNYIFKKQNDIDFEDLQISYTKNKNEKKCEIVYKGKTYESIQPSLKECLKIILDEDHFLYPLLYILYSNKEKKSHLQEAVIINMLNHTINS